MSVKFKIANFIVRLLLRESFNHPHAFGVSQALYRDLMGE